MYYILDENHNPVPCDVRTWGRMFEESDRHVALTETALHRISSVFLGLDHSFGYAGPPILFETMVFENTETMVDLFGRMRPMHLDTGDQLRYATWDECLAGHQAMVAEVLRREAEAMAHAVIAKVDEIGKKR